MSTRPPMTDLIARVTALTNNNTTLTSEAIQQALDDNALELSQVPLTPKTPFYTQHTCQWGNLEESAIVFIGYNTVLVEDTDYTIDLQRGIVTTPAAEYRRLFLQGASFDIYGAAADLWDILATQSVNKVDAQSGKTSISRSQEMAHALDMAKRYRAKARAKTTKVFRSDTTGQGNAAEQLLEGFKRNHQ